MVFNVTRIGLLVMVVVGSINSAGTVWALGDVGVGIMAWLNIVAIIILTKPGVATLKRLRRAKSTRYRPSIRS